MSYSTPINGQQSRVQAVLDGLTLAGEPRACVLPDSIPPHGNIIVFPGSFNPPTNAHLALLQAANVFAQTCPPAYVYAAMGKRTVDKEAVERPTLLERLVLLAIVLRAHLPTTGMMVFSRGLYVEQAQAIRATFPAVQRLFFLVGFDKIVQIFDARYYTDRDASLSALFKLAELLVAPRGTDGERELDALVRRPENARFANAVHALPIDAQYRAMSSTKIRQMVVPRDVPPEVQRFMQETQIYAAHAPVQDITTQQI